MPPGTTNLEELKGDSNFPIKSSKSTSLVAIPQSSDTPFIQYSYTNTSSNKVSNGDTVGSFPDNGMAKDMELLEVNRSICDIVSAVPGQMWDSILGGKAPQLRQLLDKRLNKRCHATDGLTN